MAYKYQELILTELQKNWLRELNGGSRSARQALWFKFRDEIAQGFDPFSIDCRLHNFDRRTLAGEWYVYSDSKLFGYIDKTIKSIVKVLSKNPKRNDFFISEVAEDSDLDISIVISALDFVSDLGIRFSNTEFVGEIDRRIRFPDEKLLEMLFRYKDVHEEIDRSFCEANKEKGVKSNTFENAAISEYVPDTAFIIMAMDPNHPELEDVCEAYKKVCSKFGITARRVDEIEHQGKITDLILSEIRRSEFLIGDLSFERPNVYYEIGYAHAIGKRPILYRGKGTKIHFDLSVHNVPEYTNLKELKKKLNERFEAILGHQAMEDRHDILEENFE